MTQTNIHTTKKLEKLIKSRLATEKRANNALLGKWKATVFYVNRKKCWLITNSLTKYNVILTDIKSSDLKDINQIFKDSFYAQLIHDSVWIDFGYLDFIIGELVFLPTDNDRRTTGFQNTNLESLEWWKIKYGNIKNMPIKELANSLNTTPIHIGKSKKMGDYTNALNEMKKALKK